MVILNHTLIFPQKYESVSIEGFIYNNKGEALFGADIHIEGKHKGATANLFGFFMIRDVPSGEQTLLASFVGYKNQFIKINVGKSNNEIIKIYLEEDIIEKQEVVQVKALSTIADIEIRNRIGKYY